MCISDWSSYGCSSDLAGALPASRVGKLGMIDDDPELVIGEVDRALVFVSGPARIWTDQDDPFDAPRLGGLNLTRVEKGTQDARDPLDLALLAPEDRKSTRLNSSH